VSHGEHFQTKIQEPGIQKQVRQSKAYWIIYYRNGKGERENTHTTDFAAAKRLLQSREGDTARGIPVSAKLGRVKIDDLIVDVVTNPKINRKNPLVTLSDAYENIYCRSSAGAGRLRSQLPMSSGLS
jgi:hypothetical protein